MTESHEMTGERPCKNCGAAISGRIDKAFCSTACRNAWHNEERRRQEKVIRDTNRILRRNWKVLRQLNTKGKTRVSRLQLLAKDFDFRYITAVLETKDGRQYRYCYDQGYLDLGQGGILLVRSRGGVTAWDKP